jgi:hypothetical protein
LVPQVQPVTPALVREPTHPATEQGCAQSWIAFEPGLTASWVKVVQRSPFEHCASLAHFSRHCPLVVSWSGVRHDQPVPLHTCPREQAAPHCDPVLVVVHA